MSNEARSSGLAGRVRRWLSGLRLAVGEASLRAAYIPSDYEVPASSLWAAAPGASICSPDELYLAFENAFYNHDVVVESFKLYADLLATETPEVNGIRKVLDMGAGRGELLEQLLEKGLDAHGIEINAVEVALANERGLPVTEGDAVSFLSSLEDGSLGAATLIQVVEHLQPQYFLELVGLLSEKLAPDGVLIIETVNSKCIQVHGTFWLDVSHVRMYPVETLWFYLQAAGFSHGRIIYRSPVSAGYRVPEEPAACYGNYALIASR